MLLPETAAIRSQKPSFLPAFVVLSGPVMTKHSRTQPRQQYEQDALEVLPLKKIVIVYKSVEESTREGEKHDRAFPKGRSKSSDISARGQTLSKLNNLKYTGGPTGSVGSILPYPHIPFMGR